MDTLNQIASFNSVPGLMSANLQPPDPSPGRACLGKILVLGTNRLFRDTLQLFFECEGFTVIQAEGVAKLSQSHPGGDVPDILLYSLDGEAAIEEDLASIQAVRLKFPSARTLVLAETAKLDVFTRIVYSGVEGLMLKDISSEVLRRAIQFLLLGQHLLPADLAHGIFEAKEPIPTALAKMEPIANNGRAVDANGQRPVTISGREQQIMQCLIEGLSNKAIARKLSVAEATVKVHVKGLLRKLQVSNRTQAAIWALNHAASAGRGEQ